MSKLSLTRIGFDESLPLAGFADRTVYQTKEWLAFVARAQNAEPVIASVNDSGTPIGRFTGLIIRKHGFRILGSPFPGWTTSYTGFNLPPSVSRVDALRALEQFAFRALNCIHVEIMDRHITTEDLDAAGFQYDERRSTGFEIDLSRNEETILAGMDAGRRRYIRRAESYGIQLEVANDLSFADDYYAQLEDVFAKQRLVPTYPIERVRTLIDNVHPSGNLLLVRARDREGHCIATAIFPALNDTMIFWGGASWRTYQFLHPNEAIQWFAMRYWKARGITKYDMGGGGEYKRKYGGQELHVPWGRKSRFALIEFMRTGGKNLVALKQHVRGFGQE